MEAQPGLRQTSWYVIALSFATLFAYGLVDNSRGPIFPELLKEFSLSDAEGALFFSVASLTALLSNASGAWWLIKWGTRTSLRAYCLLWSLGLFMIAEAKGFELILIGAGVFGFSLGGIGLLVNVMTSHSAPIQIRRQLMSGLHCMYGLSSLLAPLLVTAFYSAGLLWRQVFQVLAALPILILIATWSRRLPRDTQHSDHKTVNGPRPWRQALWFAGALCPYVLAEIMVSTRLVLWARRDLGYSAADANDLLSVFFLMLFTGRLFFAIVKVPLSHSRLQWVAIGLTFALFVLGLTGLPLALAATGLTMSCYYPVGMTRLGDEMGASAGFGMALVLTVQSLTLFVMHAALGQLSDHVGLTKALWAGPSCLALAMVFLLFGKSARPDRDAAHAPLRDLGLPSHFGDLNE